MLQAYAEQYGFVLSEDQLAQFADYERMMLEWNERLNLTAITGSREIAVKHFLDSIILLKSHQPEQGAMVLDVGSGAGFPGVPLKIMRPDLRLTLLDSLQKRVDFLEELSKKLGQDNELVHGRAEDMGHEPLMREQYELVTARAVAKLSVLCEYCLPFVRVDGLFAALKGPESSAELKDAEAAIDRLGGRVVRKDDYELPLDNRRSIILIEKISRTSTRYPRKPKQISRAPLS